MSIKEKVLLVEDEKNLTSFITAILSYREYDVVHTGLGELAIRMAASHMPDIILLDLGLPDMDGINVLERVREWSDVPVIVISARQDDKEKVKLLDSGANDYVTKPFSSDELLARIRTAIRIYKRSTGVRMISIFTNGRLVIDYEKRVVTMDENPIHLTPTEYKIIVLLSQNMGKVLTYSHILGCIWGPYANDSSMLRVNVANIRRKIEKYPADPEYIITEVGVGYRMVEINI